MNKPLLLALFTLLLLSCKGTKNITSTTKNLAVNNIVKSHDAAMPEFNTLAARIYVVYEDDNKQQSIIVSLRMEKDKTIWMKASLIGITIAKAKITPDRVSYYETISGTYFDGDFTLLSDWLGTEIDFKKAQAILLGQSIFPIENGQYTSTVLGANYKVQPKIQPINFIHSLVLLSSNFKIASETLSQPNDGRILTIRYDDYQSIEGGLYPSEIDMTASEKDSTTKIVLTYRKIEPNVSINFPFDIPDGYSEMKL